jgi:deoxyribose-phosphate aldolase
MQNLSKTIDHTLLKADATAAEIETLCAEAREYRFCSVCVNSSYVPLAASQLKDTDVKVCSVVGFPLGAMSTQAKAYEAKVAITEGAEEIDMVIHVGWLKSGELERVEQDIQALREATKGKILKVIFETALISKEEIVILCEICTRVGVDFVKTSTGFSTGGATLEDVALMKASVGDGVQVKASGGIRDYETARAMIEAGATRLGVSAGIAIVTGAPGSGLDDLPQGGISSVPDSQKGDY